MAHKPVLVCLPLDTCQTTAAIEEALTAALENCDPVHRWDEWLIGDKNHAMLPLARPTLPHEVHINACTPRHCRTYPHPDRVDGAPAEAIAWRRMDLVWLSRCDVLDLEGNWHPQPPHAIDTADRRATAEHRANLRSTLAGLGDRAYIITVTFRR